jgi:hypothetical protein
MNEKEFLKFTHRCREYTHGMGTGRYTYQERALQAMHALAMAAGEVDAYMEGDVEQLDDARRMFVTAAIHIGTLVADNLNTPTSAWKYFDAELRSAYKAGAGIDISLACFTVIRSIVDGKYAAFKRQHLGEALGNLFALCRVLDIELEAAVYSQISYRP